MNFFGKSITSLDGLTREEILHILAVSQEMKISPKKNLLAGKIMASCFFEPSTRTRLSFETAMLRLGGQVIGFSESKNTSAAKGESLSDAMRVMGDYSDVVVIRHPEKGSAAIATSATDTPVINGGDGTGEHPTQTLLDLFTIKECFGQIDGLNIIIAGDLLHGRTTHSLAKALAHFDVNLFLVSTPDLQMPKDICDVLEKSKTHFTFHQSLEEVVGQADILYMTRLQKERMAGNLSSHLCVDSDLLKKAKDNLKVLHPLPRVDEISTDVDKTKHAHYFTQAKNGIYARQALLALILSQEI